MLFRSTKSGTITVTALNDAPTLAANSSNPTFTEASGLGTQTAPVSVFSGANVSTVEAGQTITGLTFTVGGIADGANEKIVVDGTTITLGANSSGTTTTNAMSYSVNISSGTATIALTKSAGVAATNVSTLINSITYQNTLTDTPTSGNRVFTITQLKDSGGTSGGGVDTATLSKASTVSVVPVNDSPVETVPVGQSVLINRSLVFSSANGNLISVADVDSTNLTMNLSVGAGSLTLATTARLTFSAGDGSADSTMTFSGTKAAINTALAGLTYSAPSATQTVTLTVTASDGNTADVETIAIAVGTGALPVLDLNTGTAGSGSTATYTEGTGTSNPGTAVNISGTTSITDADSANAEKLVLAVGNYVAGDRISIDGTTISLSNGEIGRAHV